MTRNVQAQQTRSSTLNGLDTDGIVGTIDAIRNDPELARFQFRASNQWLDGGENRTRIQGFFGVGREDTSRGQPWHFTNGEPPVLLGNNEGANPVEFLLHALAGCVTTTTVLHAAARGIRICALSTELEGDIDLRGFLDLSDEVPVGYQQIRIVMRIEADCSDAEIEALLAFATAHSPVCNTICRPVPVLLQRG